MMGEAVQIPPEADTGESGPWALLVWPANPGARGGLEAGSDRCARLDIESAPGGTGGHGAHAVGEAQ